MDPSDLDDLERKVNEYYTTGDSELGELMQTWMMDESHLQICRSILEISTTSRDLMHFAIKTIDTIMSNHFQTWNIDFFLDFNQWCLFLLYQNVDRFFEHDIAFRAFCSLYGNLVKYGWYLTSEFQCFFQNLKHFFEGTTKQWCAGILLCNSIVEKMTTLHVMETLQLAAFKETTMLDCFKLAIDTLRKACNNEISCSDSEIERLLLLSMQLLSSCLSFDAQAPQTDATDTNFDKMTISLPNKWSESVSLAELTALVFNVYTRGESQLQAESLNVLRLLSALKSSSTLVRTHIVQFINEMITELSKVIDGSIHTEDEKNVQQLTSIIRRVKLSIDSEMAMEMESFNPFIMSVRKLTLERMTTACLMESPQTIIDLLKFWEDIITIINTIDPSQSQIYTPIVSEVCTNYVNILLSFIGENLEAAKSYLFPDFVEIHSCIQKIPRLARVNADFFYVSLLDGFKSYFRQFCEHMDEANECRLCLFTMSIMWPVFSRNSYFYQLTSKSLVEQFSIEIVQMMVKTGELFESRQSGFPLIEKCILLLIVLFKKSPIFVGAAAYLSESFLSTLRIEKTEELLGIFYRRLMVSLRLFPEDPTVISSAMGALAELTILHVEPSLAAQSNKIEIQFVSQFFSESSEDQFAFLTPVANKHSRLRFFQMMTSIMDSDDRYKNDSPIQTFVLEINNRLNSLEDGSCQSIESTASSLFYDLRGLFLGAYTCRLYNLQFSLWFPRAVNVLSVVTAQNTSLYCSYFKFLIELISNTNSRISFEQHSANGLKLFLAVAHAVTDYFKQIDNSFEHNAKGITYAMRIMEIALMSSASNIGALEVYNDPTLKDLLKEFLRVAKEVGITTILKYQKAAAALMKLLSCLFDRFVDYIAEIDPNFIVITLEACSEEGLFGQTINIDILVQVIRYITRYCVSNRGNPIGDQLYQSTNKVFDKILLILEQMIFGQEHKSTFDIIDLMKCILGMDPPSWPQVKSRVKLFLEHCLDKDRKERIDVLIS